MDSEYKHSSERYGATVGEVCLQCANLKAGSRKMVRMGLWKAVSELMTMNSDLKFDGISLKNANCTTGTSYSKTCCYSVERERALYSSSVDRTEH